MTDLTLLTVDDDNYIVVTEDCWVPDWLGDSVSIPSRTHDCRMIDVSFLKDVCQGGCASGAYMPAVTYYDAKRTMHEYGDEIVEYLEEQYGEPVDQPVSFNWSQLCCHYFSMATENWAMSLLCQAEIDY